MNFDGEQLALSYWIEQENPEGPEQIDRPLPDLQKLGESQARMPSAALPPRCMACHVLCLGYIWGRRPAVQSQGSNRVKRAEATPSKFSCNGDLGVQNGVRARERTCEASLLLT